MSTEIDGKVYRRGTAAAILREARKAEIRAEVIDDPREKIRLERRAKNLKRIANLIGKREVKIDDET